MSHQPAVSCLCVTHDRVPLLRRSIACFLAQDWPARELLVAHEAGDHATAAYVLALGEPSVRAVVFPAGPRLTLGAKRNLAVQAANGPFVANWDDDDWYAPARLSAQMDVLAQSGAPACVLRNVMVYDTVAAQAYVSQDRPWENSLVCRREAMPPYADKDVGEDLAAVEELSRERKLVALPRPDLYVYVYHGRNACSRLHFRRNLFAYSMPLTPGGSGRIAALLEAPLATAPSLAEVLALRGG
jgi:glycosyltransferase involved in cell wall biosynthesis